MASWRCWLIKLLNARQEMMHSRRLSLNKLSACFQGKAFKDKKCVLDEDIHDRVRDQLCISATYLPVSAPRKTETGWKMGRLLYGAIDGEQQHEELKKWQCWQECQFIIILLCCFYHAVSLLLLLDLLQWMLYYIVSNNIFPGPGKSPGFMLVFYV